MIQDPNDMEFCESCKMNVFPSRKRFNIKTFGFFVILILIIVIPLTIIYLPIFSGIFIFVFIMWGFMLLNPYTLYYGLQKKQYCPRCYNKTVEKSLEYIPFGDKQPEIYNELSSSHSAQITWYCPYCGTPVQKNYCKSCGKKLELKRE